MLRSPKTLHVGDSRCRPGTHDPTNTPWSDLVGKHLVVEEKVDGSEASLYFTDDLDPVVATRGEPAPRTGHFNDLWRWMDIHEGILFDTLGDRYIMFGQWVLLKHTIFYDQLPPVPFLEEDVYDRQNGVWLSTPERYRVLEPLHEGGFIHSIPVLTCGMKSLAQVQRLPQMVGVSDFISPHWQGLLMETARREGMDTEQIRNETDMSGLMEGLYIKVEDGGQVTERYKWVRWQFLHAILQADRHWKARRALRNQTR